MRDAFIDELIRVARHNSRIALVVGDLGYSVIEPFADEFPDRFINAGVAEQNMTGIAAGFASEGYHVFTYSIANFPTWRCAEQIRNDVDYHKLPVTVVAVGGGLAYGALGYSHHAIQDYALMRVLPNMLIASPGDSMEVRACVRYLVENPGPSYLRLGRGSVSDFHTSVPLIHPGEWLEVSRGESAQVLLTTGAALNIAMERVKKRTATGSPSVCSLPLWGMSSKAAQAKQAASYRGITTIEDHLLDGGFGSWMLEALMQYNGATSLLKSEALDPRVCGTVGNQEFLNDFGGLCA